MKKTIRSLILGGALALSGLEANAQTNLVKGPVTNNTTYSVVESQEYQILASSADILKGTVSGNTNDWITQGQLANLTATANTANHYRFLNWSDGDTNASRAFTVISPSNLVANFDIEKFAVNIQGGLSYGMSPTNFVNVPWGGSVTSSAANTYYTNAPGSRRKIIGLQ